MKVWIVDSNVDGILKVFDSKEKADEYLGNERRSYGDIFYPMSIEEFELE